MTDKKCKICNSPLDNDIYRGLKCHKCYNKYMKNYHKKYYYDNYIKIRDTFIKRYYEYKAKKEERRCIKCDKLFHPAYTQVFFCEECAKNMRLMSISAFKESRYKTKELKYNHRFLALSLIPNMPSNYIIKHIDTNKENDDLSNLLVIKDVFYYKLNELLKLHKTLFDISIKKNTAVFNLDNLSINYEYKSNHILSKNDYNEIWIEIMKNIVKSFCTLIKDNFWCLTLNEIKFLKERYPNLEEEYILFMMESGYSKNINNFKLMLKNERLSL